jgi:hypothetical protein
VPPPPSQSHVPRNPSFIAPPTLPIVPSAAFDFHPTLGFSEEYSDNFQLTPQNKEQNFRTTITPGGTLLINAPRTQGTVLAGLGIAQDSVNSFGDFSIFGNLSASVQYTVSPRLTLYLSDSFIRNDEPSLADQFGLRQQRQTFTSNSLSLSADWLLDIAAVQGYYQLSTFSSGSDTVSNVLGFNAGVPIGAVTAIRAGYEFSYSNTSGATAGDATVGSTGDSTGDVAINLIWASVSRQLTAAMTGGISGTYSLLSLDSARIWNVALFSTYDLPGRLSLSASLGYSSLTSTAGRDISAVSTNTHLTYRLANAVFMVGFFQDFQPTFTQGENFGVTLTRSYTGSFGYGWTPFIDTTLRATYSKNENTGVGNTTTGNTNTFSAQASLSWRVRRWLTLGLDYTYTRYDQGASIGIATENHAAVRLSATF